MNTQEIEKFSKLLDQEEARIRKEISQVAISDPYSADGLQPKPADYGGETDDDDIAREATDSQTNAAIEPELEKMLQDILKAKDKIEKGTYGICEKCGNSIPAERLEVLPMTPFCVNCAE